MATENPGTVTPKDRLIELDKILDEYERCAGLPQFLEDYQDNDTSYYLNLTKDQIEKLNIQDCAMGGFLLSKFAFYLQRAQNRENARNSWADNLLKSIVSGKESNYRGSWESQFMQAVKEDKYCSKLFSIKNYAQQRAMRLTYLSNSVRHMAELLINVSKAKLGNG